MSSFNIDPTTMTFRPRSDSLDSFSTHTTTDDALSLSNFSGTWKPRASSSSFCPLSFSYKSFPALEDDSDDDDDQVTPIQSSIDLSKPFIMASTSSPSPLLPTLPVVPIPIESASEVHPFHLSSFNYTAFTPLFDEDESDEDEERNGPAKEKKGSLEDEDGFEAVTPSLLPQKEGAEVVLERLAPLDGKAEKVEVLVEVV